MEGYARIAEAFRLRIGKAAELLEGIFPPEYVIELEARLANDFSRMERNRRAAERLATLGYRAAAEAEGVCEATIYYRANAHYRNSKKPEVA
jgi:hypothetical protein